MVSTTLKKNATDQSTTSSSNHPPNTNLHRHLLSLTANSNCKRLSEEQHNSSLSTSKPVSTQANNYFYNCDTNANDATKISNITGTPLTDVENSQYLEQHQHPSQPPLTVLSNKEIDEVTTPQISAVRTNYEYTNPSTVNLSKSLLSPSPLLNDQISLLFPKCRPKHVNSSKFNSNNNATATDSRGTNEDTDTKVNANRDRNVKDAISKCDYESDSECRSSPILTKPNSSTTTLTTDSAECSFKISTISPSSAKTGSYYQNVNIITQSPPPTSISPVSSESLSTVTPRKSMNPFICSALTENNDADIADAEKVTQKGRENDDNVPASPPVFYYHTSNQTIDEIEPRIQYNNKVSYDIPRKHSIYHSSYGNRSHLQIQRLQEQYLPSSHTHMMTAVNQQNDHHNDNGVLANHVSQIPFAIDYREMRQNITTNPASSLPDTNGSEAPTTSAHSSNIGDRTPTYQQSAFTTSNHLKCQQHNIRIDRTSTNDNKQQQGDETAVRSITSKRNYHNQPPQRQQRSISQHQPQNSYSVDHLPLVNHYLYGSKTSLEPSVNNEWEKRDREECESWEREREKRVQRRTYIANDRGRANKEHKPRELSYTRQHQRKQIHQQQQQQQHKYKLQGHQQQYNTLDGSPSIVTTGEVVVFDDINESWQNLRVTSGTSTNKKSSIEATELTPQAISHGEFSTGTLADELPLTFDCENDTQLSSHTDQEICIDRKFSLAVESKHGIMEYEGSPRRIGKTSCKLEEEQKRSSNAQHTQMILHNMHNISTSINCSTPGFTAPTNNGSPQPQYPARPGFPQRIISPARGSTSPIMVANCSASNNSNSNGYINNKTLHQYHKLVHQQQQQQCQHSPNVENNAEDTSNDISEIGTISDVITPDTMISCAASNVITTTTATTATTSGNALSTPTVKSSTFDYLYEFSETRKVLEEFFKGPSNDDKHIENGSDIDSIDIQYEFHSNLDDDLDVEEVNYDEEILDVVTDDVAQYTQKQQPQEDHIKENAQQQQTNHNNQLTQPQKSQYEGTLQLNSIQLANRQQNYGGYTLNCHRRHFDTNPLIRDFDFFLDSASRSSTDQIDHQDDFNHYSPEATDYDSNFGDLDTGFSGDVNGISTLCSNYAKCYASSMPVLEDGLSSGHTSDTENNNQHDLNNGTQQHQQHQQQRNLNSPHPSLDRGISMLMDVNRISMDNSNSSINNIDSTTLTTEEGIEEQKSHSPNMIYDSYAHNIESPINGVLEDSGRESVQSKYDRNVRGLEILGQSPTSNSKVFKNIDPELDSLYSISIFHRTDMVQMTPPPPAPAPHRKPNVSNSESEILQPTPYKDLRSTINATSPSITAAAVASSANHIKTIISSKMPTQLNLTIDQTNQAQPPCLPERNPQRTPSPVTNSPVWLPRHVDDNANNNLLESSSDSHLKNLSVDEDDVDTDLETDRLLGHQRLDDQSFYNENKPWERKPRSLLSKVSPKQQLACTKTRNGYNALLSSTPENPPPIPPKNSTIKLLDIGGSISSPDHSDKSPIESIDMKVCVKMGSPADSDGSGCISDNSNIKKDAQIVNNMNCEDDQNGGNGIDASDHTNNFVSNTTNGEKKVKKSKNKEGGAVLIEGVLFRAKYLGSTQLVCEGQPTKSTRMMQAEEAVSRIKALAPDSDIQPSTEVDLFISTEKIMVLNTDLKEIMMDHALRTISYIADIGDLVVLMARRRFVPQDIDDGPRPNRTPKMICHVFESDEAQFIAQSIGQAFQVAYMEFLKANGIEDHSFVKEMDYQEVLNSQEIFGDELEIFAKKELQKEVVVPKAKGEILGVVIVESGWGSMLPTVVIANLMSSGAAARCGQLNIGDQLIAINGLSLVGLPLSTCQTYIKNSKNQTVVKFTVVPCAPVVEVKIKRPNTKYQLGFSVQNGVICSLLRGGIAERGGVRVGHRIIEINNQSVVAVPHEKIVNLLATSVGEILMKTMPTSMFRLLTGQENPIYI